MANETNAYLPFNEGLPTKPDVDLLLQTWPKPSIGDRFEYETVAKLLGVPATSVRFRTVTNNWRNRMRELGFVIECEAGAAFYVATAEQISAATYGTLRTIGRKARKHRTKLAVAKIETESMRATIEHQSRLMLAVEKDTKKHRMNLLPPTVAPQAPQIAPPKKKGAA